MDSREETRIRDSNTTTVYRNTWAERLVPFLAQGNELGSWEGRIKGKRECRCVHQARGWRNINGERRTIPQLVSTLSRQNQCDLNLLHPLQHPLDRSTSPRACLAGWLAGWPRPFSLPELPLHVEFHYRKQSAAPLYGVCAKFMDTSCYFSLYSSSTSSFSSTYASLFFGGFLLLFLSSFFFQRGCFFFFFSLDIERWLLFGFFPRSWVTREIEICITFLPIVLFRSFFLTWKYRKLHSTKLEELEEACTPWLNKEPYYAPFLFDYPRKPMNFRMFSWEARSLKCINRKNWRAMDLPSPLRMK